MSPAPHPTPCLHPVFPPSLPLARVTQSPPKSALPLGSVSLTRRKEEPVDAPSGLKAPSDFSTTYRGKSRSRAVACEASRSHPFPFSSASLLIVSPNSMLWSNSNELLGVLFLTPVSFSSPSDILFGDTCCTSDRVLPIF